MRKISKRTKVYWLCQVLGWGAHAATNFLLYLVFIPGLSLQWKRYGLIFGCAAILAGLTTDEFRYYIKRNGWLLLPPAKAFFRVIASSVVLGCLITAEVSLVFLLVLGPAPFRSFSWLPGALFGWISTVFTWTVIYFGIHYFEQYRQAEMEKLQLQVVAKRGSFKGWLRRSILILFSIA